MKLNTLKTMTMTPSGGAIAAHTRRYLQVFRRAHAFSPGKAINPHDYGISYGVAFKRLLKRGILRPVGNELYYLDEPRRIYLHKRSNRIVVIVMLLIIIIVVILFAKDFEV